MQEWWNSLNLPLQLFYAIGILSGVILLIQVAVTLLGFDHADAPDVGIDHPDGLGLLSIRSITGFFFGFGWSGVICLNAGWGLPTAMLVGLGVGSTFLFGIYLLMRGLFSLRASGTLDYANAVGQTATVYVTIPPGLAGSGQVEVMVQGRLATVSAMSPSPEPLAQGAKVRVTRKIDQGTVEVEKL